jgi:predicted small metal-binding protein
LKPSLTVEHLHMRRQIAWTNRAKITDRITTKVFDHISQVGVIRSKRGLGEATLDSEPRQEVTNRLVEVVRSGHGMTP